MSRNARIAGAAVIGLLLLALFYPTLRWLVGEWLGNDYYSHGPLVPVISGARRMAAVAQLAAGAAAAGAGKQRAGRRGWPAWSIYLFALSAARLLHRVARDDPDSGGARLGAVWQRGAEAHGVSAAVPAVHGAAAVRRAAERAAGPGHRRDFGRARSAVRRADRGKRRAGEPAQRAACRRRAVQRPALDRHAADAGRALSSSSCGVPGRTRRCWP